METKHLNIKVYGKVQAVFFRTTAKEEAEKLGISGFVKNEPDGTVYIEVEGIDKDLKKFLQWCHEGPPVAEVDEVKVTKGPLKNYSEFEAY